VVTVPRGGRPFDEVALDGPIALIVGSEGAGLPGTAVAAADERVTIPMTAPVESLNTAVCAALMVFEARRQRYAHRSDSTLPLRQN
jgi:TrmH family RNA methyltransferase